MRYAGWGLLAAFCVGCALYFLRHPIPPNWRGESLRPDPVGAWQSGAHRLVFGTRLTGTIDGVPFRAQWREQRACLIATVYADCAVATVAGDSLIVISGIATLLHPGDTIRVYRRMR